MPVLNLTSETIMLLTYFITFLYEWPPTIPCGPPAALAGVAMAAIAHIGKVVCSNWEGSGFCPVPDASWPQ